MQWECRTARAIADMLPSAKESRNIAKGVGHIAKEVKSTEQGRTGKRGLPLGQDGHAPCCLQDALKQNI